MGEERRLMQECEAHNRASRLVTQDRSASIAEFWRQGQGHFLIAGSNAQERRRILMHKVAACLERNDGPAIILTSDDTLHESLTPAFTRADQELWITGGAQANYHLLYGLDDESICAVFRDMMRHDGDGEPSTMETYLRAFLTLLRQGEGTLPSLPAMARLLLSHTDAQLISLAQGYGLPASVIHQLTNFGVGGKALRNLVQRMQGACRSVSTGDCTEHNVLIRALHWYKERHPMVMVISSPGGAPYLFQRMLSAELQRLMDGGRPFHLIFHDAAPVPGDGLMDVITRAADRRWDCGLSVGSLTGLLCATRQGDKNPYSLYPLRVLLTDAQPELLSSILDQLPPYEHHEVATVKTTHRTFSRGEDTVSYQIDRSMRPRVRLEDLSGAQALLMGHDGMTTHLVTRLN